MFLKQLISTLLLSLILVQPALSVLVALNNYEVITTGDITDMDQSSTLPITATSQLLNNNNGNVLGSTDADASSLIVTSLNANSFEFTGTDFASASVDRIPGAGNQDPAGSATATHIIEFELGVNEVVDVSFNLTYSIIESNADAEVSWTLNGPDPNTTLIGGTDSTPGTNSSGIQAATLSASGTYTLTITAAIPNQSFRSNRSASANLDSLTFTAILVPEPSSTIMLVVGLAGFIWRRSLSSKK